MQQEIQSPIAFQTGSEFFRYPSDQLPSPRSGDTTLDFAASEPPENTSDAAVKSQPFASGTLLAGRYRIASLLRRGGMGEVYRADDLILQQTIALKLIPGPFPSESGELTRLHREVRLARQISHPNICRVFDILKAAGRAWITMEFVDGDDLDVLMRRIGRFTPDKALEIAHQLCAGLAAAHEAGVLHHDLKPANIMLDGRGRVRLTDFGLAVGAGDLAVQAHAGTPAYMAPEQIAGDPASIRSEIYSLGLVLYELFTGTSAFESKRPSELLRKTKWSLPVLPSHRVDGLDPALDRVILHCLEPEPLRRPESMLQIATALSGTWHVTESRRHQGRLVMPLSKDRRQRGVLYAWTMRSQTMFFRTVWVVLTFMLLSMALSLGLAFESAHLGIGPGTGSSHWSRWFELQTFFALLFMACIVRLAITRNSISNSEVSRE